MTLFDQVKNLNDLELYGDLKAMCSLVLTMSEHNPDLLTLGQKYHVTVYYGTALYHGEEYKRAETIFRKALHLKKLINKTKGKNIQNSDYIPEVDVKFKIYQCHMKLKQHKDAIMILESISSKQRTPKINMALGHLQQRTGMDRSAIAYFKEVLRECPLSMEAGQGLLNLGVKTTEILALMMSGCTNMGNIEWLNSIMKGVASTANGEFSNSISVFKVLDTKGQLRDSIDVLSRLGEAQLYNGDYSSAKTTLQRAHALDPLMLKNMDLLAYLYHRDKDMKELEKLGTHLISVSEKAPEAWVALGYFSLSTKKYTRAVYFAHKAYLIDNLNVQALLLKGTGLLELPKIPEATLHFREALRLAQYRYDTHKGLLDAYIASKRIREAMTLAANALKHLGTNARSLTLYASVLAKDPVSIEKAKTYLEKAMKMDPTYLEAVYTMADILSEQQQPEAGITLLRNQLRHQSTSKLHELLGNFLMQTNDHQEAHDQYSIALSMDPTNTHAKDGIEKVEKRSDVGLDNTYDVELEDMSENEDGLDRSDVESTWSDTDL